ncbi:MAG: 4-(cytidine 5'-diphospho)-2-C-methyl-D-erythritol kinase [Candidatus Omnitrophica bacterium]|nr:4-(cytidine 5'-diphospho)-2-C-methyl-D-erythritol kinase [Candidatus Omnitrophota bacterium]MBU4345719.1 4-(cytidine 5'-diphospho)-2-C-methyl-D-erythritol kinase [Candidatus Omnitrophota bacterium]MBU4473152.1 4-(cytidine 5'-diphospho)-2-C-methyl-D-erythritol kinase [Candidatus Omnitrophota bacterium]MCG2706439.1 4-(cytidine 5'-diphospho)-2-C-methyl-D-erythritol kinase [Candidatus Omnitrophota bacterium]
MVINSYAKLNLYLEVLSKRKDRYHSIKTIFERINLRDKITLRARQDKKINVICSSPGIPKDSSKNLACRAAKLLQSSSKINRGVDIRIIKRIPVAAGLGGGSSNAAAVLRGLNKLWRLNLTQDKLVAFARKIGSDVPFFIYNIPFAEGRGRGDKIRPLRLLNHLKFWHILVIPKKKVATERIYKVWDSLKPKLTPLDRRRGTLKSGHLTGLTRTKYGVKILNLALRKGDFTLIGKVLFNSLEQVTSKLYPEVGRIKEKFLHLGLKSILMSGSGPAVFGIVPSRKEALYLYRQLKEELKKQDTSAQVFVTQTS